MSEYEPAGAEFIVNTAISANQIRSSVTRLNNGGFAVVWQTNDTTQDGSSSAIKCQIFDASGAKVGVEFLVNTATAGGQQNADVTVLANGNFVVTWDSSDPLQDGSGFSVKAQVFSSNGVKIGSELLVNTTGAGDQSVAEVAALANGGFVITWSEFGANFDQFAQVFDPLGSKVGGEFVVNAASTGLEDSGEVVGLANGTFLVTWRTSLPLDGNLSSIMGRIFNADGTPAGAQFVVNTQATGSQTSPTATALANGNFVVAWRTDDAAQDGSSGAIKVQLFAANGTKIGGEFLVNTQAVGSQSEPRVSDLPGGGFMVTWRTGDTLQDGSGAAIKAQVFDANGVKVGGEFLVNQWTSGDQTLADISTLANGDVVITWTSVGADGSGSAVSARLFSAATPTTITSNGGGDTAAISVDENGVSVTTVVATSGSGGSSVLYSITGGADAALFAINATTGALSFVAAPDFEAPGDAGGNNVYDVTVTASDGSVSDSQAIAVTVTSGNDAPVILGSPAYSVGENSLIVGVVSATDPDGDPLTYAITGGTDAARFTIDAQTGVLRFVAAPNYEQPLDAGANNVFDVTVAVSDGTLSDSRALSITVTNVNEAATFVSSNNVIMPENYAISYQVEAVDPDSPAAALTYAITGGADAALFTINAATGHISFLTTPDFEAPADAGANNIYNVTVSVSDGVTIAHQAMLFQVYNVNEAPVVTSPGSFSVQENTLAVGTVTATDVDSPTLTYSITGGADSARFTINAQTGALSFVAAPNFEAPVDSGANNVYNLTIAVSDGSNSTARALAITVTNANEVPTITSNGGGATASHAIAENTLAVAIVAASDPDGTAPTFTITGGADAALFAIDAVTGALSFIAAPNFEAPGDAGGDNVYDVMVTASDGSLSDSQAIAVTVADANETPAISSPANLGAVENTLVAGTVAATDPDGDPLSYAIVGGADGAKFAIDAATGMLSFVAAPNFEAPGDADGDNVYQVTVSASDGSLASVQAVSVTVTNANEAPLITSQTIYSVAENALAVGSVAASDPDGTAPTYAITGGADANRFTIDAVTGALVFVAAPNFEAPSDAGANNVYDLVVTASDGSLSASQAITVTVGNVNEAPTITSGGAGSSASVTVNENTAAVTTVTAGDPDGTAITYSIVGGADAARFAVNASTGALSFVAAPNWEAPTDAGANNVYDVVVQASDGALIDTQAIAVTVANVVDGVTLTGTSKANTLTGTEAEDTINGLGGNDTLNGGAGADSINGGDGADQIIGGAGADVLTGGAGVDTFVYQALADSSAAIRDFITDFNAQDKISLSAIDANSLLGGDQAFSWIGTANFSNVAGQLRYYQQNGNTYVTGDVNGDGVGDFSIEIDPLIALASTNFIL